MLYYTVSCEVWSWPRQYRTTRGLSWRWRPALACITQAGHVTGGETRGGLCTAGQPESQCEEALLQEVQPTIRGIVQRKLRVSLNPANRQQRNQEALELVADIQVALLEKLKQMQAGDTPHRITDWRKYTAVVSYNACTDFHRDRGPVWTSLKNSLRYFLTHIPEYAVWKDTNGELVGGFAYWHHECLAPVDEAQVTRLCTAPHSLQMGAWLTKPIKQLRREDWQRFLTALFKALRAPLTLDDLVTLVMALFGMPDENAAPPPFLPLQDLGARPKCAKPCDGSGRPLCNCGRGNAQRTYSTPQEEILASFLARHCQYQRDWEVTGPHCGTV